MPDRLAKVVNALAHSFLLIAVAAVSPPLRPSAHRGVGVYQIGDDHARSWIAGGA